MSKILLIGDPHLQFSKFNIAKSFLSWIDGVVAEYEPDLVVNLGDTFHDHSVLRSEILSEFSNHVRRVTDKVPYVYVLGNHDQFKPKDSTYHALQAFKDVYPNFTMVDSTLHRVDLGITFVPFQANHEGFPIETQPICIAHQTFIGCDFGGYRPDEGVDPESISAEIIISGHIHNRQQFGKVIYPGSPFSQSLKDIGQSKGLMLFDTETYHQEFIACPLPSWRSLEVAVSDIKSTINYISNSINQKDNWVIVFTGPRKEITAVLESNEWKKIRDTQRISTRTTYTDSNKVERVKIQSNTVINIVDEYFEKIYSGGIDKTVLRNIVRQLFNNDDKNNV